MNCVSALDKRMPKPVPEMGLNGLARWPKANSKLRIGTRFSKHLWFAEVNALVKDEEHHLHLLIYTSISFLLT